LVLYYASSLEVLDLCPFRKEICCFPNISPQRRLLEQRLGNLVYRLYNLNCDEVKVIEPGFPPSRAEHKEIGIGGGE
jgi:hypothetical protein